MKNIHVQTCYYFDDYGAVGAALEHNRGTMGAVSEPGILQFSQLLYPSIIVQFQGSGSSLSFCHQLD